MLLHSQVDVEFMVFQPQPPQHWGNRCVPLNPLGLLSQPHLFQAGGWAMVKPFGYVLYFFFFFLLECELVLASAWWWMV